MSVCHLCAAREPQHGGLQTGKAWGSLPLEVVVSSLQSEAQLLRSVQISENHGYHNILAPQEEQDTTFSLTERRHFPGRPVNNIFPISTGNNEKKKRKACL